MSIESVLKLASRASIASSRPGCSCCEIHPAGPRVATACLSSCEGPNARRLSRCWATCCWGQDTWGRVSADDDEGAASGADVAQPARIKANIDHREGTQSHYTAQLERLGYSAGPV